MIIFAERWKYSGIYDMPVQAGSQSLFWNLWEKTYMLHVRQLVKCDRSRNRALAGLWGLVSQTLFCRKTVSPSLQGKRPVLVWIHGGAFVTGSVSFRQYVPSCLSQEGDIVVINLSYRVGVLGFLYLPEKEAVNLGLEDLICELQWARDIISHFGGDPRWHINFCPGFKNFFTHQDEASSRWSAARKSSSTF
ncbi:MAG: carboxylesterase family protein [Bacteroidales bacterium]|nr:carboxylesterase family protein [Bacteroidales bacterium]